MQWNDYTFVPFFWDNFVLPDKSRNGINKLKTTRQENY